MGGPWRERGSDPAAWRPPKPRVEASTVAARSGRDNVTWIVISYVASVLTSFAVMLTLMKHGW
jgi:hypothetical protein